MDEIISEYTLVIDYVTGRYRLQDDVRLFIDFSRLRKYSD